MRFLFFGTPRVSKFVTIVVVAGFLLSYYSVRFPSLSCCLQLLVSRALMRFSPCYVFRVRILPYSAGASAGAKVPEALTPGNAVLCKTCGEHLLEVNQSHGQDDAIGVKRRAISLKRHLAQSHTRVFCKLMRRAQLRSCCSRSGGAALDDAWFCMRRGSKFSWRARSG